jgi:hypothetical protein
MHLNELPFSIIINIPISFWSCELHMGPYCTVGCHLLSLLSPRCRWSKTCRGIFVLKIFAVCVLILFQKCGELHMGPHEYPYKRTAATGYFLLSRSRLCLRSKVLNIVDFALKLIVDFALKLSYVINNWIIVSSSWACFCFYRSKQINFCT